MNRLLTSAAVVLVAVLAAPSIGAAQEAGAAAKAQTQAAAAQATGKPTTDAPAASRTQGAAWAVKQAAPAATPPATAAAPPATAKVVPHGDIIETARASGQFKTFLKAAEATNLTGLLKTNQNLTVFAPTDAAFAALPAGELDRLMGDKAALQKLLTHHLINARVDSGKIKGAKGPVPTVAGDPVELDGSGQVLTADNATIVQPDVMASNGVLHVVDQLLTPGARPAAVSAAGAGQSASSTGSQVQEAAKAQPTGR